MTRKHPPAPIDPDDSGFNIVGHDWTSRPAERVCLIGLDSLARDLYYTCLRPFADHKGDVIPASYYRFIKLLTPRSSPRGGPRFAVPTKQQISDALDRLAQAGLLTLYRAASMREGVLQIRVVQRFGEALSAPVRRGVRRGVVHH